MGLLSLFKSNKPTVTASKPAGSKIEGKIIGPVPATVKSFSPKKGFGFVTIDGNTEVFVHKSALPKNVITLEPGQKVSISYGKAPKGLQVDKLNLA